MQLTTAAKGLGALLVILALVAVSPLVDAESGWKNTLGDIVWTGMFLTIAALAAVGVTAVVRHKTAGSRGHAR